MLINHSHILEVRELKDSKIIICYIQIANRSVEYYHGQTTPHKTYRWMQADDWAKFDANLEMMLGNQAADSSLDKMREHSFQLNASIHVRVTKSRIPVDAIKRCIIDAPETWGAVWAFEFFIEYKEYKVPKSTQVNNTNEFASDSFQNSQEEDKNHEYEPPFVSSQPDGAHVPYTPSPKAKSKLCVKGDNISETPDDEAYSPKPVAIECIQENNNESSSRVPLYKPTRMILEKQGKSTDTQNTVKLIEEKNGHHDDESESRNERRDKSKQKKLCFDEKRSRDKKHQTEHKLDARGKDKRREERKITSTHEDDKKHGEKKSKRTQNEEKSDNGIKEKSDKNIHVSENNSSISSSPTHHEKRKRNLVNYNEESLLQPRRSSRSPMKPKRFNEDLTDIIEVESNRSSSRSPKRLNKKSNKFNEDLFGSDDDEDEKLHSDFVTNKSTKIKTSASKIPREKTLTESVKKKRKHNSPLNCSSEKRSMDSWLGKKLAGNPKSSTNTTSSKHKETKSSKSTSSASMKSRKTSNDGSPPNSSSSLAPLPVAYLSKEEIEENILKEKLQLENNSKIKEMLKQMAGPTPEKVETLNIKNLSLKYILNSFEQYKPQLDEIFRGSMKKAHKIKGYEGINNYMVMSLIDNNIPLDMMNKLQDAYEPDCEGIPTYTSIFANAMMPEWIIRLFMDKHKLTREEAIKHVKAQDEYELHLKSVIENRIEE